MAEDDEQENSFLRSDNQRYWVNRHYKVIKMGETTKRMCIFEDCDKTFQVSTSHVHLRRHWKEVHGQSESSSSLSGNFFHRSYATDKLVQFIVDCNLPYCLVNRNSFRGAVNAYRCSPGTQIIDRHDISEVIRNAPSRNLETIKKVLGSAPSVALTFDFWTAKASPRGFGAITAHFVDANYTIKGFVLEFEHIEHPHDSAKVSEFLKKTILKFGIAAKIIGITSDNASVNISAMKILQLDLNLGESYNLKDVHFRCFAHTLHLIVLRAISELNPVLDPLRRFTSAVKASNSRVEEFDRIQSELEIEESEGSQPKRLIDECDTRWGSVYLALARAIELKDAIDTARYRMRSVPINPILWDGLEKIKEFLNPIHRLTEKISGENYETLHFVENYIHELERYLLRYDDDMLLSAAASASLYKLRCYKPILSNTTTLIASLLDPRHKVHNMSEETRSMIETQIRSMFNNSQDSSSGYVNESQSSIFDNEDLEEPELVHDNADELTRYLRVPREPKKVDVLKYWMRHEDLYPNLAKLAKEIFPIQASSVACERVFSYARRLDTAPRNRLSSESFRSNILAHYYFNIVKS